VLRTLINRQQFVYSPRDMFMYYLKCVTCRYKRTMKMRDDLTKHYKFRKAEDKLIKKLDVVTLVQSIRQLELISYALLDERQNFMLKF